MILQGGFTDAYVTVMTCSSSHAVLTWLLRGIRINIWDPSIIHKKKRCDPLTCGYHKSFSLTFPYSSYLFLLSFSLAFLYPFGCLQGVGAGVTATVGRRVLERRRRAEGRELERQWWAKGRGPKRQRQREDGGRSGGGGRKGGRRSSSGGVVAALLQNIK